MEQPQQKKGWFGRNWLWAVPVGCLLPLLLCGGGILGIFFTAVGVLESTDVYIQSVAAAKANAEVKELLGEPISAGIPNGSINMENDTGNADVKISLTGPKGSATMRSVATKANGAWTYTTLEVTADGSDKRIDLRGSLPK